MARYGDAKFALQLALQKGKVATSARHDCKALLIPINSPGSNFSTRRVALDQLIRNAQTGVNCYERIKEPFQILWIKKVLCPIPDGLFSAI